MKNYEILKITPFGFVFELLGDSCFFAEKGEYEIYLNDEFYMKSDRNIVSLLSLKYETNYKVCIKGYQDEDIFFSVKTLTPGCIINVKDYNATGDGVTCDTSAINMAIYCAPKYSTVYIPKGKYMVDQVLLKSDIDIYLERGAIICQTINRDKLAIIKGYQRNYDHSHGEINTTWEGHPLDCYSSLIFGKDVENVHFYGDGIIDGNGDIGGFWENPKVKGKAFRPKNILLVNCCNVDVSGLTSINSASWNVHALYSTYLHFTCMKIESIEESPNTDGINPESSSNIEIRGCHFNVGDDCIAIKSGKYYMSVVHPCPTSNVVIRQCYMEKGHGGVVIGSEMSCGVMDVFVSQCLFRETDRGLRIKTRRGRGKSAIVNGITFENVIMDRVKHCFVINMYYNCDPDGKSNYVRSKEMRERDEFTPTVENIHLTGVNAQNITGSAVFIYGLPESKVSQVRVENCSFSFAEESQRIHECPAMMDDFEVVENLGVFVKNAKNVTMNDNIIDGEAVTICEY